MPSKSIADAYRIRHTCANCWSRLYETHTVNGTFLAAPEEAVELTQIVGLIGWIPARIWETVSGRRQVRLLVHRAYFGTGRACYFLNVTNLSRNREVVVTHVYFDLNPQIHALVPDRLPPKTLKPDETWETWIEADKLPSDIGEKIFNLGRVRLSNGQEVRSRKNKRIPSQGTVPGGPIATPPR